LEWRKKVTDGGTNESDIGQEPPRTLKAGMLMGATCGRRIGRLDSRPPAASEAKGNRVV
jgi:hypothetical protein